MKIWEFFEKMDEMVYVTDIETNELIYMNQELRNSMGIHDDKQYIGRMCYEILQGSSSPCEFCTNCRLKNGEFLTWTHMNPVLNKRVLLKDTLVEEDGKKYRIELAIDADSEHNCKSPYFYARSETILNECLHEVFSTPNAEESIDKMLQYIGETFCCDRTYIFEFNESRVASNTYEWCKPGVTPQKEFLQNIPYSAVEWWMTLFASQKVTVIPDLEDIRTMYPESYAILKPQGIYSLAAGPITSDGEIIGFIGVDNPDATMLPMIETFLHVIGYFTSTLLRRREWLRRLNDLSYHDQLTGALNRHALTEQYGDLPMNSVGVIYCDITGLKETNDTFGHKSGDQLICHCYEILKEVAGSSRIYRTGGDEFIVLCPEYTEQEFESTVFDLRKKVKEDQHHIAIGYVWSDQQPLNLDKLISDADQVMYEDKRNYYRIYGQCPGVERRRAADKKLPAKSGTPHPQTPLQTFLSLVEIEAESLIQSVSENNDSSYFYLGDMQKDLFYISDNMRDDFGFQSNLVYGLLSAWGKRISTPEDQDIYWQDITQMLREKRTIHDLRYRIRDSKGNNQWVRCYGILKWDEEKTKPLFFSGRVTHQDKKFVVDPITGFLREHASFQQLNELQKREENTFIIGFSLNGLTEINSTRGREYGDRLIQKVSNALVEHLSWQMTFYRLEGARCMAIVNPVCARSGAEALIEQISDVVKECYESKDVTIQKACAFGVIQYPNGNLSSEELINRLLMLIRVAKQNTALRYADDSTEHFEAARKMSSMALTLSQDVMQNMKNFRIVVQPVVSAGDGSILGGEVLLRWSFDGQDVSPAIFVPMLEKNDLIHVAGRWVFEQAVSTCVRIHTYDPTFYLTFNVSLQQLSDPLLLPFMKETLKKYSLSGSNLIAELTESFLDEQPENLTQFVMGLQKMGLYVALDDFGSGYSSLRMLLRYPSSIIKLDRSLIAEVMESEENLNFIRSIVFACHQFGKTVCIEGVETEAQNKLILDTGCDMIQGYYYYRPIELGNLYQLLSRQGKNTHGAITAGRRDALSNEK